MDFRIKTTKAVAGGAPVAAPVVAFVGANGTNPGAAGVVPAPAPTDNTKFLRGDGAWAAAAGGGGSAAPAYVGISPALAAPTPYNIGNYPSTPGNLITLAAPPGGGSVEIDNVATRETGYTQAITFDVWYEDGRTQVIYLQSEIGGPRPITAVRLYIEKLPAIPVLNFKIRIKHTPLANYGPNTFNVPGFEAAGWTVCYAVASLTLTQLGEITFTFSVPFAYNGTDNLFIDFVFDGNVYDSDGRVQRFASATKRALYKGSDSNHGDPLAWDGAVVTGRAVASVPRIVLVSSDPQQRGDSAGNGFLLPVQVLEALPAPTGNNACLFGADTSYVARLPADVASPLLGIGDILSGSAFTVAFWIRFDDYGAGIDVIRLLTLGGETLTLSINSAVVKLSPAAAQWPAYTHSVTLGNATYHHVAVVKTATGSLKYYCDGVLGLEVAIPVADQISLVSFRDIHIARPSNPVTPRVRGVLLAGLATWNSEVSAGNIATIANIPGRGLMSRAGLLPPTLEYSYNTMFLRGDNTWQSLAPLLAGFYPVAALSIPYGAPGGLAATLPIPAQSPYADAGRSKGSVLIAAFGGISFSPRGRDVSVVAGIAREPLDSGQSSYPPSAPQFLMSFFGSGYPAFSTPSGLYWMSDWQTGKASITYNATTPLGTLRGIAFLPGSSHHIYRDGSSELPGFPVVAPGAPLSVSCWLRSDGANDVTYVFDFYSGYNHVALRLASNYLQFEAGGAAVAAFIEDYPTLSPAVGVYRHILCVKTAADRLQLFIDGVLAAETADSVAVAAAFNVTAVRFGYMLNVEYSPSTTYRKATMVLSDVAVWNLDVSASASSLFDVGYLGIMSASGLVPATVSFSDSKRFLRGDGTWSTPATTNAFLQAEVTVAQTLSSGVLTRVNFDSILINEPTSSITLGANWNLLTVRAGRYRVHAIVAINFGSAAAGRSLKVSVYSGSSLIVSGITAWSNVNTNTVEAELSYVYDCTAGNEINFRVQTTGGVDGDTVPALSRVTITET